MALKLIEGFDHFNTAATSQLKGWSGRNDSQGTYTNNPTLSYGVAGRLTGNAVQLTSGTSGAGGSQEVNATIYKLLPATFSELYIGVAINFTFTSLGVLDVFAVSTGTALFNTATVRVAIDTSSGGKLKVLNSSGTTIATGTASITSGAWNYIELHFFINGASGTCEVHLNGAAEIATTTGNFGSTPVDRLLLGCATAFASGNATTNKSDDIYVCDTSGVNNTFLGDVAVETIYPSAAGASTQFTPDTGSNWARVSETAPDGDTSYVADGTSAHRDSYAFGNLASALGTVYGVQINSYARKDDAGLRQIAMVTRPTTVNFDGATQTLSTSYGLFSEIRDTNPDTSTAWTVSSVNAAEFGLKVI